MRSSVVLQDAGLLEQQLAWIARRTSHWAAIMDRDFRVVWANEAVLNALGLTLEQMRGLSPFDQMGDEYNDPQEIALLLEEIRRGLGVRTQVHARLAGGEGVWLDMEVQPVHDADGELSGFAYIATDVTEQVHQRNKLRALLDALPVAVTHHSVSGRLLDANARALEIGCVAVPGVPAPRLPLQVHEDMSVYLPGEDLVTQTLQTGRGVKGVTQGLLYPDGRLRWLMTSTELLLKKGGSEQSAIACSVDVTEQHERQLLFKLAVDGSSQGVWITDLRTQKVSANERLFDLLGYVRGEFFHTTHDWLSLFHPQDAKGLSQGLRDLYKGVVATLHFPMRARHREGHWIWLMLSCAVAARDAQGHALRLAGACYDISEQKRLEEQLRESARTDSLTQLPNRAAVVSHIQACIDRKRDTPAYHFAVLFMDFDRFKQVNDTLGHAVGDELLRQMARRLQRGLRAGDAFVQTSDFGQLAARLGGDEFVVVLDDIRDDLDACAVAARLLEVLGEPYQIDAHQIRSSVSIGVVTSAQAPVDADGVLCDADIAMYEAKREGRDRYVMFDPAMRRRVHDDVALERDLRLALERGEFHVVYQPVVNLVSGELQSVEALLRWSHPQRGAVSPLAFIPLAEATGLIGSIGRFVLRTACQNLREWQSLWPQQAPARVAVNLSRAQLRQPGMVQEVQETLDASGLSPAQLTLEVTESLAAQDEMVQQTLQRIRALGVELALDDFGTGYSSLSCLHELPVGVVKIDRSFVSQALQSNYHRVMIEATIRMAQVLGLGTVAEGVETPEQAALMGELGCVWGQGYLYSRPVSGDALQAWAQARVS